MFPSGQSRAGLTLWQGGARQCSMDIKYELQGHRGARDLFPENTIEGFVATRALGVRSIELDVAVTADGVAVVAHDVRLHPDIARGPDGAWVGAPGRLIREMTLAEVAAFDVGRLRPGSAYAAKHPRQSPVDGARIPTLEAVFAAVPDVLIDAELKTSPEEPEASVAPEEMAEIVLAVARRAGALGRLRVRSFDWRGLRYLQRVHPDVALAWLTGADGDPEVVAAAASGPAIWAPRHDTLDAALVAKARSLGLSVRPWTVNDPDVAARLLRWGAEGICTDAPDLMLGLFGLR
jgi:glycerophosphoryl diester phosphodiesterase